MSKITNNGLTRSGTGFKGLTSQRVLGDIDDKRSLPLRSNCRLFRGLSVCLSVAFMHCAQTTEDIDDTISAASSACLPDYLASA